MLITNFDQDPVKFVIENEAMLHDELMGWHKKALRLLLSEHEGQKSGNKETLINNILSDVKLGTITLERLQRTAERYLEEGKRHVFVFDIVPEHVKPLRELEAFSKLINEKSLKKQNLLYHPVANDLIFFDYLVVNDVVSNIKLTYKEQQTLKIVDYENNRVDDVDINYHIFITIDLTHEFMTINLEPIRGLIVNEETDETVSVKKIAMIYKEKMKELLGLEFYTTHDVTQQALHSIWSDSTKYEVSDIQEVLDGVAIDVQDFVKSICSPEKLNLCEETQVKITNKILGSLENSILTDNYDTYKDIIEQARHHKPGFITEHKIRERTGGVFKQKSADRSTPIEETDTFSDTKVTIDQLERVQQLYFTWNGFEYIPPGKVPTIIESFNMYDLIIFTSHTTLEEIEHVLNQLKRYKDQVRASRRGFRQAE